MNSEIENLINMALADGDVTEKERAIILRKAEALGEDKDEVEMILDGKIALIKKEQAATQVQLQIPKSNKEGDLKKCPSCGAPVESFKTKCNDCGHEFRNIDAPSSIKLLYETIEKASREERSRTLSKTQQILSLGGGIEENVLQRTISIIDSFPIPNTKEDLMEFLSASVPKSKKSFIFNGMERRKANLMADVWRRKSEQIIMKVRFSMKDDKKTLEEVEIYAKQLGIK